MDFRAHSFFCCWLDWPEQVNSRHESLAFRDGLFWGWRDGKDVTRPWQGVRGWPWGELSLPGPATALDLGPGVGQWPRRWSSGWTSGWGTSRETVYKHPLCVCGACESLFMTASNYFPNSTARLQPAAHKISTSLRVKRPPFCGGGGGGEGTHRRTHTHTHTHTHSLSLSLSVFISS